MKRLSQMGLLLAAALIMSYIEALIPLTVGIPGMKLGLPNVVILFILYWKDEKEQESGFLNSNVSRALTVNILRILLSGFLFGNMFAILYSLAGAVCSFAAMLIGRKTDRFSALGVSILGGVFHNMGQLAAARFLLGTFAVIYYAPPLLAAGALTGFLLGLVVLMLLPYQKIFRAAQ